VSGFSACKRLLSSKEAAEKGMKLGETQKNIPQGLKPNLFYLHLAARLKSCPDASGLFIEFFGSLKSWSAALRKLISRTLRDWLF
jgi:hypothetical protein